MSDDLPAPEFNDHGPLGDSGSHPRSRLLEDLDFIVGQVVFVEVRDLAGSQPRRQSKPKGVRRGPGASLTSSKI